MLAGLASFMQHPMHKKLYARHLVSVGVVLLLLLVLHRWAKSGGLCLRQSSVESSRRRDLFPATCCICAIFARAESASMHSKAEIALSIEWLSSSGRRP